MRIVFIRRLPWGMTLTEWWLAQLMVIMADENHWVMAISWQSSLNTISDGWQCEYFMDIGWRVDGEWMESGWLLCVWRVRELVNIGVLWLSSSFSYSLWVSHGSMVSVAPNLNVSWSHGLSDSYSWSPWYMVLWSQSHNLTAMCLRVSESLCVGHMVLIVSWSLVF